MPSACTMPTTLGTGARSWPPATTRLIELPWAATPPGDGAWSTTLPMSFSLTVWLVATLPSSKPASSTDCSACAWLSPTRLGIEVGRLRYQIAPAASAIMTNTATATSHSLLPRLRSGTESDSSLGICESTSPGGATGS